jgi:Zn-dependent protease with chaperone function
MTYHVSLNNEIKGPFSIEALRQMIEEGSIRESTFIIGEGSQDWVAARDLEGLYIRPPASSFPPLPTSNDVTISIEHIRHPQETASFYVTATVAVLAWLILFAFTLSQQPDAIITLIFLIIFGGFTLLAGWISGLFFKASLLGNAVRVSNRQYPEIHKIVSESAAVLGLDQVPDVFVMDSGGIKNALAARFLGKKYILLFSALVDNMLSRGAISELRSIILHELGHHAAGHTSNWKQLLLMPTCFVPFLGSFYSRCCEYTCDRVSYAIIKDRECVQRALMTLAHGTESLASKTDIDEFSAQDKEIHPLIGFYLELLSSHPRLTRRISAVKEFAAAYRA